jgi:hypothetical protein
MQPACKPDSVRFSFLQEKGEPDSIIYLVTALLPCSYDLPPGIRRAALLPVYMVFQPIRRTAHDVATMTGELLPHLFTLSPLCKQRQGGYSLLHCYTLADIFPLGSMVLCVARTFLITPWRNTMEQPAAPQR